MKSVRMLILALGLVALATASSFATVPFLTTSTTNIIALNAQTGLVGGIYYTPQATGTVGAGEIINIAYPAQISNLLDIQVWITCMQGTTFINEVFGAASTGFTPATGTATAFANYGVTQTSTTSGVSVTVNQTTILIQFSKPLTFNVADPSQSMKIDGVRLDTSGFATPTGTLMANLSNTGGQAMHTNPNLQVGVFSEPLAFATTAVRGVNSTTNVLNFFSNTLVNSDQNRVTVTLNEVFPNAFETKNFTYAAPYVTGIYAQTRIKLAFSNIPTGMTITAVSLNGTNGATFGNGQIPGQYGTPSITTQPISIGITAQNGNALQGLEVGLTFGVTSGTTNLALNPGNITMTATLDPAAPLIGSAYAGAGSPDYPFNSPKFQAVNTYFSNGQLKYVPRTISTSIPVVITPLVSNLLSPFNLAIRDTAVAGAFRYDTGISISNTSGTNPSLTYPAGLPGTIKVILYPLDGSGPKTFETGAEGAMRPGLGLNSSGALAPKATWVVLLSQLLTPAGYSATADFRGFIRFQCNFQGAIGIAYIADGDFDRDGNSQGYVMQSDVPYLINTTANTSTINLF